MLIASSCLKDEVGKVSQINFTDIHAVTIATSDSNDLRKNLRWISKGVAGLGHSFNTFKPQVHDFVLATDYYEETNENIENLFGSSFLYASEHYTWLDLNIPTNDYDSSYFFDITLDGCEGKTCIRIPEADIVDTSKLHVFTPDEIFGDVESSIGYYFNTATGLIDSLTITEENMDSVYLWVVGVAFNCDEIAMRAWEPCNGNDDCEPELSENRENCSDCATANLSPFLYVLVVDELRTKADHFNKYNPVSTPEYKYQEDHLQGKYVINLAYSIQNNDNTIEYGHRDHTTSDHMSSDIYPTLAKLGAWGNGCPQKRTKTRTSGKVVSNRGVEVPYPINDKMDTLEYDVNATHDGMTLDLPQYQQTSKDFQIIVYEQDVNGEEMTITEGISTLKIAMNKYSKPYTYDPVTGEFSIMIDTDDVSRPSWMNWTAVGSEYEMVVPLDGELELVLKLIPQS